MAKPRPIRRFLSLLIIVIVAAGAWIYFHRANKGRPVFSTVTVTKGNVTQVITATGALQPVTSVEVGSQVSGLITEVLVDYNSPVKANQLIAKIDPATYDQNLRQANADLASAQANETLVKLNTQRTRDLRKQNLVSQQDLDQAVATLAQADATLLTKQAAVVNAQVNLNRCSIYSPIDGIVLDRQVDVGKTVAASLNAPVLFVIANDLSKMEINAAIAEADIGSVKVGQMVKFTVDAFPNRQFHGKVIQIRNSPTTESNVVTYQTIIEVRNDDMKLMPGMTANVSVVIADRPDTLRVPNSALRVRIPESLLPPKPAAVAGANAGEKTPAASGQTDREKMQQLFADAGYERGSGPPSPEVRAKIAALAKERGIDLSALRGGHGRDRDNAGSNQITSHTVYKLGGTAENPELLPVTVKLGITDGINTEVIDGLKEGDVLVNSVFIADADAPSSGPTNNPFSGGRRRF
jgi:HlyD family secretion protein